MSLSPGSRLGPYVIAVPIGAGGMGEVFRARDTRLNRDVAIKVLPTAVVEDKERVARFRREAQLVASLNHPNVAAIYGLEETNGTVALALELVDGEDLAERLAKGAMPVEEAIGVARQIAEGLEAAHERGIVHRDLKPANVKLTKDGTVKILDFGLAKAYEGDTTSSDSGLSQSPTMSRHMTEAGMILGTAAYMSPEQARGRAVDKRADVWSFGVVLHEMLTGKRLFAGETVSDTLAAVLRQDVNLTALPVDTPASVRRLLARCFERDPKLRLRDIGEARIALARPGAEDAAPIPTAAPVARRRPAAALAPLAVAIAVGLLGAWTFSRLRPAAARGVTRLTIALPPGQVLSGNGGPVITRDGRTVAYTARDATGAGRLYLRALDRFEPILIPGSEGAQSPFFSPDGSRIAFFARGKLLTAAVAGGAPTPIADASAIPHGGTWNEDGTIVYAPTLSSGLLRVPASGGKPEQLTQVDDAAGGGYAHVRPQSLPGGRALLFTIWGGSNPASKGTALLSLSTRAWTRVSPEATTVRYARSGHLLQSGPHGVRAVGFDPERPRVVTPETFVVDDLFFTTSWQDSWFSVSDTGTLVYVPGDFLLGTPTWVSRDGRVTSAADKPMSMSDLAVSPDGSRIVMQDPDSVLWALDLRRGTKTRLTGDGGDSGYPLWSRDGARVVFGSNRTGDWEIYSVAAAGGPATRMLARKGNQFPLSFAPDGTLLFNERSKGKPGADVLALSPDGTVTPVLDAQPSYFGGAQFSPDGRAIAYLSDETGRDEVYVKPFGRAGDAVPVSTEGGIAPRWSPDGKEVFFRHGDAFLAASVSTNGGALSVGDARKLFEVRAAVGRSTFHPGYSVAPDGRFLVHLLDPRAIPTRIDVVENWFGELLAKVPAR
jgi:eukaryotic-like serine/threonine-protein kinase